MHELSVIQEILKLAEEALKQCENSERLKTLNIVVGRLSGVNIPALEFAFEAVKVGTLFENSELNIIETYPLCICKDCGAQTQIEELVFTCPQCAGNRIEISGGEELTLDSIEVEED